MLCKMKKELSGSEFKTESISYIFISKMNLVGLSCCLTLNYLVGMLIVMCFRRPPASLAWSRCVSLPLSLLRLHLYNRIRTFMKIYEHCRIFGARSLNLLLLALLLLFLSLLFFAIFYLSVAQTNSSDISMYNKFASNNKVKLSPKKKRFIYVCVCVDVVLKYFWWNIWHFIYFEEDEKKKPKP